MGRLRLSCRGGAAGRGGGLGLLTARPGPGSGPCPARSVTEAAAIWAAAAEAAREARREGGCAGLQGSEPGGCGGGGGLAKEAPIGAARARPNGGVERRCR